MNRILKVSIKTSFAIFFLLGILGGVLFWRLHQAPVSADKLAPYIMKKIEGLSFETSSFSWKKFYKSPKLLLKDLRYEREKLRLSAKHAEISFSLWKILLGQYEVETLKIISPQCELSWETKANQSSSSQESFLQKIEKFFQAQNLPRFSLEKVEIFDGTLVLKNNQTEINLQDLRLSYKTTLNRAYLELIGKINGNLFFGNLDYTFNQKLLSNIKVEKLSSQILTKFFGAPPNLFSSSLAFVDTEIKLEAAMIEKEWKATVRSLVKPTVVQKGQKYQIPTLTTLDLILKKDRIEFVLDAATDPFPTALLPSLWPQTVAPVPRNWVITNIIGGKVDQADIKMKGTIPLGTRDLKISDLGGTVIISGADVDYITGMPRVQNVKAIGTYDQKNFHIEIKKGNIKNLKIPKGHIILKNMHLAGQDGDVTLRIEGPLQEVLGLIDSPPLHYCQLMKINPKTTAGTANIDLNLKFPLESTLKVKDVKVRIDAALKKVVLLATFNTHKLAIQKGALSLKLNNAELQMEGPIVLEGSPMYLKWHELFDSSNPNLYKAKYELAGVAQATHLEPFLPGFLKESLEGGVDLNLTYKNWKNDRSQMALSLNLEKTHIHIPALEWQKPALQEGQVNLMLEFKKGVLDAIPTLTAKLPNLLIQGNIRFKNGLFSQFKLSPFYWNNSSVEIEGTQDKDNILNIEIRSPYLNISGLLKKFLENKNEEDTLGDFVLKTKIQDLVLGPHLTLHHLNAKAMRKNKKWEYIDFLTTYNQSDVLEITLQPEGLEKKFHFRSTNISPFLKTFELVKNVEGGEVLIKGTESLEKPDSPLIGTLKIADINIIEAPLLAQLFSLVSLEGIANFLGGKGLKFSEGYINFEKYPNLLIFTKAGMRSTSLGLTALGTLDTAKKEINLEGVIVPAYIFNQLLSHIPIIGQILSGGDAEKGVFSMSYAIKGSLEDPKISVNPLSVLAPGLLKTMLEGDKPKSLSPNQLGSAKI